MVLSTCIKDIVIYIHPCFTSCSTVYEGRASTAFILDLMMSCTFLMESCLLPRKHNEFNNQHLWGKRAYVLTTSLERVWCLPHPVHWCRIDTSLAFLYFRCSDKAENQSSTCFLSVFPILACVQNSLTPRTVNGSQ